MKKNLIAIIAVILFIVIGFMWYTSKYNSMVTLDEEATAGWAQGENVYQRRSDLIPNLVNTVKGAANFEKETLTQVIEARSKATSVKIDPQNITPEQISQFQSAQSGVSGALSRLLVTVERYPDIKANKNFLELQTQLERTENRISVERRRFNELVKNFNAYIRRFPNSFISNLAGFQSKVYFESDEGADKAPKVSF